MEAQQLYIKITLLALKSASYLSKRRLQELNSGIIQLRQLLSCAVCCQLLIDPFKPKGRRCGHHVCRLCLRGRKRLMPSCSQCNDCSDFKTYEENKTMATQLLCYKTLCVHLLQSSLYAQLSHQRPDIERVYRLDRPSRIKLPDQSTQWFIREGANYEDMFEAFSTLPELPEMPRAPSSLPAETPPTTAATTPELPYEQHMPDQLSIYDIELEAAATGEQAQFEHQLPMMTQMLMTGEQPELSAYFEPSWSDQVEQSGALTLAAYTSNPTYTTYMTTGNEQHMPTIGQVVQIPQQLAMATETATQTTPFEPVTTHVELLLDEMAMEQAELSAEPVVTNPTYETRKNSTIISSATATQTTAFQPVTTHKRSHVELLLGEMAAEQAELSAEPVVINPTYETRKNSTIISSATATQTTAFQPVGTYKRSHVEMLVDEMAAEQAELSAEPVVTNPTYETRKNSTIISSATQTTAFQPVTTHKRSHDDLLLGEMAAEQTELREELSAEPVVTNPTYETRKKSTIISSATATQTTAFQPVVTYKRSHVEMLVDEMEPVELPVETNPTYDTRRNLRSQKPTIISSILVKPPATAAIAATAAPVVAVNEASVPLAPISVASAPVPAPPPPPPPPVATTTAAAAPLATATTAAVAPVKSTPVKPRETRAQNAFRKAKPKDSRMSHICRCGTTSAPGKATCRNSRCTCYVAGKSCVDCKCIGCKNPHKDATDSSDEDEEWFEKTEPTPAAAAEAGAAAATAGTVTAAKEPTRGAATATKATGVQSRFTLVPLDNLQQTQHPLVLMQNENGQYQGFNIFNGAEPVDPAQLGFQRVPLQSNDGNTSIPQYAYVMPPPVVADNKKETPPMPPPPPSTETETEIEQPAKKFKKLGGEETLATDADCSLQPNFSPIKSVDQLVSAGAISKAAAGDSSDTDKERAIFEYFLDEEDFYYYCTTIYSCNQKFYAGSTSQS